MRRKGKERKGKKRRQETEDRIQNSEAEIFYGELRESGTEEGGVAES
jgi:hypothetical protein